MIAPQTIGFCEEILATAAGRAFDGMAATYDAEFTRSLIGRAQRDSVWREVEHIFKWDDRILELNCGTGEDALFLANHGMHVTACDASAVMIETASRRMSIEAPEASITFHHLPTEQIVRLHAEAPFDGVLSNFSGLNCVEDLPATVKALAELVRPGASLMLCLSTRFCLTEIAYFLLRGEGRKAMRRCSGSTMARVGGEMIAVHYPTVLQLRRHFAPGFKLRGCTGIGVAVPPSYLEAWAVRWPRVFKFLCTLDRALASLPFFRVIGDHMLLHFVRESA